MSFVPTKKTAKANVKMTVLRFNPDGLLEGYVLCFIVTHLKEIKFS